MCCSTRAMWRWQYFMYCVCTRFDVWATMVRPSATNRSISEQTGCWYSVWSRRNKSIPAAEQSRVRNSQSWSEAGRLWSGTRWQMHYRLLCTKLLVGACFLLTIAHCMNFYEKCFSSLLLRLVVVMCKCWYSACCLLQAFVAEFFFCFISCIHCLKFFRCKMCMLLHGLGCSACCVLSLRMKALIQLFSSLWWFSL